MFRASFATLDNLGSRVQLAVGHLSKGILACLLILFTAAVLLQSLLLAKPARAQTAPPAFSGCTSNVYLAQLNPTRLYRVSTTTNPFTYPTIGSPHERLYNAIAYNPADNYIYAVDRPANSYIRLLRIGSNGAIQVVGTITGGGINNETGVPLAGEIGADGYYYLKMGDADANLYRVNLSTRTATKITMSQSRATFDLAWHNGLLYGYQPATNELYTINPSTGAVTVVGKSGVTGTFGGLVSASNGIFGLHNGGGFYQFNLETGKATRISDSPSSNNNDAAKCYSSALQFGADLSITKTDNTTYYTPGTSTTYTIVVRNAGPFGVQGARVNDPLPTGITSATWTCGSATNGGACGQASGTGAITNRTVDLPVNASVTFTVTMQIPASFSGDLINTATVTAPNTALDTNTANNSASDKDVGIRISKTLFSENGTVAGEAEPGERLTYRITLTNTGTSNVTTYSLADTLDANTTFVSATNGGTHSGGTVTWNNLSIAAGGSLTLTVVVDVKSSLPASARNITNIVRVPGKPTPSCPSSQCVVTPLAPKVTYTKTSNATQAKVGDVIRYTLTATVANGATNNALTLTDTLGSGLTFNAVTSTGAFSANTSGAPVLRFTLPAGTAPGTYAVSYTATVNEDATGTVKNTVVGTGGDNPTCSGSCTTTATIISPEVTFAKSASTTGPVKVGDVITFTLTTTVANSKTTSDTVLLTDTLGTGLDFTGVTSAGAYSVDASGAPVVKFTLPAGTGPGTYPVTYTATVNASASNEVSNVVVGSGGDNPSCTTGCSTTTTVQDTSVTYAKTSNASGPVEQGDVISYTLTATVANAATKNVLTLTDTLGDGLDFGTITSSGAFSCTPGNPLVCTLPAGTAVGSYSLTYSATVKADASGTVKNTVVGTGGDNPSCSGTCSTTTTVAAPVVTYAKTTTATQAKVGDIVSYTLTATVAKAATRNVLTLSDMLGAGLEFVEVTNTGNFTCTAGSPLICTLPAGTAVGSYSLTYTAAVQSNASGTITNTVVGTGGDSPSCGGTCTTSTPVTNPAVAYSKTVSTTGPVKAGDVISYTLTATVANAATGNALTLTDTLGAGLDFTSVTNAGSFTCVAGNPLVCTLPAGTPTGTYSLTYTATVKADASGTVTNAVVGTGGDNPACSGTCSTTTTVGNPAVTYAKSSNATQVKVGDVVTYTLTATVANAATKNALTLTDTLGAGLTFQAVTNAGAFSCTPANPLVCTLPAGTPVGVYSVSYTATVNASASGAVSNAVVGTGGDNPTCAGSCTTTATVTAPQVIFSKTASTSGPVKAGDVITYTLTTTVANSKTTSDVVLLTDTLGAGLDFGAVTNAGAYSVDASGAPVVKFRLPAGTGPGTYAVTYTATVKASASGTVGNVVVGSGGDNPTCTTGCSTTTTVQNPAVTYAKAANTSGPVKAGDVISYTLTATVANSATKNALVLTDTLGAGLDFGAVSNAGNFSVDTSGGSVVKFTLPAGTPVGTYSITYTATVNDTASGSVANAVLGTGGDAPSCSGVCTITTPVTAPTVTYAKSANATQVKVGDVVSYTLTATVANAATRNVLTLTDTLGAGLTFNAMTSTGAFTCSAANPLVCTLPAGTPVGIYSLTYTATVDASASGSVANAVVGTGGDSPACAGSCSVTTPLIAPEVFYAKTVSTAGPVKAGDVLTFTLTTTVANSKTTSDTVLLTDTLGTGLDFTAVTDAGAYSVDASGAPVVRFTLPAGTGPGAYAVTYTATVNASASGEVSNVVVGSGGDNPTCTTGCSTTTTVQSPTVTYAKTASTAGPVKAGDVITYTLTATVANAATRNALVLTDTLGTGLDFTAVTNAGAYSVDASGAPVVKFTLPAGAPVGTYTITYTATVNGAASGTVSNVVVGSGGDNPVCAGSCGTTTTVANPAVTYAKSANATQVKVGDVITYTLTATVANAATTDVLTLTDTLGAGLDFKEVTNAGAFTCTAGNPLVCTLPAGTPVGTYSLTYTATTKADASGTVNNTVVGTGGDTPTCAGACSVTTPVIEPEVSYAKTASTAGPVKAGDVITYTLTTTVANSKTTSDVVLLTDTLGTGLDFTAVTNAGAYSVDASGAPVVKFTLPAGTGPGTYAVTYTATVNGAASGTVSNVVVGSGGDNPVCTGSCGTSTTVEKPTLTYAKSANATQVKVGDTITYTLTATVAGAATTDVLTLTDTLGAGLDFGAVTNAGAFTCTAGNPLVCTLPAGTSVGTYEITYTATVNAAASGSVSNAVVGTGGDNPACAGSCSVTTPVIAPTVSYAKTTSTAGPVKVGDVISFTLTTTVANSKTTSDVVLLTDTLGTGLDFTAVTNAGAYSVDASGAPVVKFTLPAGTGPGTYAVTYTATVNGAASGTVSNVVVGSGADNPVCTTACSTTTTVADASVTYAKSVNATQVKVGDTLTYTLRAIVSGAATKDVLTLTDTLGAGFDFGAVTNAGAFTCSAANPLVCTLPAGTSVGTYEVTYTATVNAAASGSVSNAVVGTGGDNPACVGTCTVATPVIAPEVSYAKTASTAGPVKVGNVISFTLTTTVANSKTTSDVVLLTDTLGTGLDFTAVTNAGAYSVDASGAPVVRFTLPAGTGPGTYAVTYTATVNGAASGTVSNVVVGSGGDNPVCTTACSTTTTVADASVTYAKSANATQVKVGDTLTYTLRVIVSGAATKDVLTLTDTLGAGLDFGAVTNAGAFTCSAANPLVCTLPAGTSVGTYEVTYTATVNAAASGSVSNAVVGTGGDNPACSGSCSVTTPVIAPAVSYAKTASTAGPVKVGDVISFTLTTTVANSKTTSDVVLLTDTLGTGLDFTAVTNAGAYSVDPSGAPVVRFTLPAGTGPGTYAVTYTATVNGAASGSVSNVVVGSGADNPVCTTACSTTTEVEAVTVTYAKAASTAGPVKAGDVISFTLTTTVANAMTTSDTVLLTDTLGTGLDFTAVTSVGAYSVDASGAPVVKFTLPAGTGPGTYAVTYTATVNGAASGEVSNVVVGSGADNPVCAGSCGTTTTVEKPAVSYAKKADVTEVKVGDVITYTLTATVADAATTDVLTLTDTLGAGLDFGEVTSAGAFTCTAANPLVCTLPEGTPVGTYEVTYTAAVNASASGSVTNAVVGTGGDNPACTDNCSVTTPLAASVVTYAKRADATEVKAGDVITYTLTATVADAATTDVVTLTDTLGAGLDFGEVTNAGAFTCTTGSPLVCTLPAGTQVGTYEVTYTATVNAFAAGEVTNAVVGTGGDNPACADNCAIATPVAGAVINVIKSANPAAGETVRVGDAITYSLIATVANGATTEPLVLVDTPDQGLTITDLPDLCDLTGGTITCTLPAGTPVGTHSLSYTATVNANVGDTVRNLVTASGGGGASAPSCDACVVEHKVELPLVRLVKTAAVREVKIGDLVRYTLSLENVGQRDLIDGNIVDMPPAGFTYVEGSLRVADGDNAATVSGQSPLRFGGIDVRAGETATLVYLMRVGAGVRKGTHVNQAQVHDSGNAAVSNPATAQVELVADPLVDDTLIFGTVFDDRDGDGWQDSAKLTGLAVKGGFAPEAYIAGSTTIDHGQGMTPEPDASAPLLHGIRLGSISARQSEADPVEKHRIVIRQRLSALSFTDDFVLTSDQGITVRMNAAGETRVEKKGEAARGLTAAEPRVERRVAQVEGGYVVDYIIENAGIDERGIPGVRIASVEGLITETDQFGRYHLEGIPGGAWERGRNFILKVDPSTLPEGAVFTTDNPLLRRITPGIPVRFDWGVKLPSARLERTQTIELDLGSVVFAPGSSEIRKQHLSVIEQMAAKVREYQGGEVVIDANGTTEALAFERAEAVKAALLPQLDPASAQALVITVRGRVDDPDSMIVGLDEGGALLGTVLFDTDKAEIRPEFEALLDRFAAWLTQQGGGAVAIIGHTDVRASFEYNTALGMRRARAVFDALASRLPPDIRANLRVDHSVDPAATVDTHAK